ncbi:TPA: selenium metabolism membrane protein YedE/FdhT [Campylobacter coli]|uniref:selenium metabolism membrane protein YedE/FdhT n=1 Tax=Campylobacter coli TaxID=195 RepID=UPI0013AACE51|nr:selenium metabolism membrane protein YedE/FdhT [Campylobacter coli]ECL1855437.1 selenium metabolism membrane protein YedE/FdhT [Campylobacter coli]ECP7322615.1 selenium metabolism membrane protein YedE/FdhT [Campylobacter coli]EDO9586745.1 selenium metabolism membrane protein YedE/FdhT [Campylobacter coli]EKN8066695.1 selenium metabolism membrane protein YedE/FdhT [Campylobacter coli]HED9997472.1 selenium metabolism membrane protein YedE/FdhT [Campylobacter coli]
MNSFKQKYLINFWDNSRAMITLGILSAVYFGIFGGVWAVTGEMTRWGGEFLELLGMDLNGYSYYQKQNLNGTPLTRTDGIMLIGMFIGCLVAALLANKVKFRLPASNIRIFQAIVGGILSGYGARLAFGCNLANFFTGLPYFSLHTWFFGVFMVLGIYLGVKLCNTSFFKPKAKLQCANKENIPLLKQNSRAKFHFVLGSILFVAFLIWVFYLVLVNGNISTQSKQSLLALALIFGFAFGFIISRGQICFTACFRDLFLFGRENAIKGALIGMIIASLIAFAFILHGHNSKLIELSPAVAIGAFLFGFGIVFAGGCECGWTYRACEGQSHFMIVGIANIIGTMILALTYNFLPSAFKEGVKINLLNEFGNLGGFFINLALFILMFACVLFYKKHFFLKLNQKG